MVDMLGMLKHRGRDATGAVFFRATPSTHSRARVALTSAQADLDLLRSLIEANGGEIVEYEVEPTSSPYFIFRGVVAIGDEQQPQLIDAINAQPTLCVHSFGRSIEVVKDVGTAENLARYREMSEMPASIAIGHTRLATESIDNINFAHPFVATVLPELAIVHNGQLTNYYRLRRQMEALGVRFKTFNDSELIAHYLAYQIRVKGKSFRQALEHSLDAFDGVYSYLCATPNGVGAVRDRLGLKPILFAEDKDVLLLGSEQCSIESVDSNVFAEEMSPGEVRVWLKN
ncbi:MAG: glutamine amidotransferase [Chloroflexi bacterium]|nr:glutamine amidotransferase [Chloroflexota bacterium]